MSTAATVQETAVRGRVATWLLFLVCSFLLITLHPENRFDSDEGVILNGAWALLNGLTLYTDFFEFVAPGSFYLVFAAWKLFGAEYLVAKSLGLAAMGGAAVGVYRTSQLLLMAEHGATRPFALFFGPVLLCLLSVFWTPINHNTFNIAFVVWSGFFVTRSILRRSWIDCSIGGLICGMATLFLQHRGALLAMTALATLIVFYARDRDRAWLKTATAFLAGWLAPVSLIFVFWPASLLIENLIIFPASHYREVNRVDSFLLILIVATFPAMAAWLLRRRSSRAVWFLMSLQMVFLTLTALQRADPSHITAILFPLLAISPLLLTTVSGSTRVPKYFLVWICAGLLVLPAQTIMGVAASYPASLSQTQHPVLQYVKDHCVGSRYIWVGPFGPGMYYATGKLNATRYSMLFTDLNTSSQFLDAAADLESHRPLCAITNYEMVEKFNYNKHNPVDDYIVGHYSVAYQSGPITVWMVRSAAAP